MHSKALFPTFFYSKSFFFWQAVALCIFNLGPSDNRSRRNRHCQLLSSPVWQRGHLRLLNRFDKGPVVIILRAVDANKTRSQVMSGFPSPLFFFSAKIHQYLERGGRRNLFWSNYLLHLFWHYRRTRRERRMVATEESP